jgi:hypothetical protein
MVLSSRLLAKENPGKPRGRSNPPRLRYHKKRGADTPSFRNVLLLAPLSRRAEVCCPNLVGSCNKNELHGFIRSLDVMSTSELS